MGFSRQDTGVGYHALLQGIYLTQGLNPRLMSPAVAGGFFTTSTIWEAQLQIPHFIDTNHLLYRKEFHQPILPKGVKEICKLN